MMLFKFRKLLSLIRFLTLKIFFNKSSSINFIYSDVKLRGINRIELGVKNIIYENSSLIVDSVKNGEKIELANNNIIASYAILKSHGGFVKIGNNNFIGEKTQIQGRGGVEIGDNCLIAANVFISSSNHDFKNPYLDTYLKKEVPKKTQIKDSVWIGTHSVIVAGITVEKFAIIGAGSIVTKDVVAYTMVAGNPAKAIKKFDHLKKKWLKL